MENMHMYSCPLPTCQPGTLMDIFALYLAFPPKHSHLYSTTWGTTDWFQIGKGVCQGCILSPCLFNLNAEYIMRNAGLEEVQARIKIAGRNINNLRCWEPAWGNLPMAKVMRKGAWQTQRQDHASGVPLDLLEHLPPNQNLSALLCYAFHQLLWH